MITSKIQLPEPVLKEFSNLIREREYLLDSGCAQSAMSRALREVLENKCKYYKIALCAHNFGLLGSLRYKKYINQEYPFLLTDSQVEEIISKELTL